MFFQKTTRLLGLVLGIWSGYLVSVSSFAADGFGGGVSPSRFEVAASAGDIVRRSLEIYNFGDRPSEFGVSTADWNYSDQGSISFSNELSVDSCRPWVKLERHSVEVVPSRTRPRAFRFEVHVPENTPRMECRFAIMLDSDQKAHQAELNNGALSLPVVGRIGIIVYIAVGGAKPDLELTNLSVMEHQGQLMPSLKVTNSGDAHGRLDSDIAGVLPSGKRVLMSIATSPIMPGQTREMPIHIADLADGDVVFPLAIKGRVYNDDSAFQLDATIAP